MPLILDSESIWFFKNEIQQPLWVSDSKCDILSEWEKLKHVRKWASGVFVSEEMGKELCIQLELWKLFFLILHILLFFSMEGEGNIYNIAPLSWLGLLGLWKNFLHCDFSGNMGNKEKGLSSLEDNGKKCLHQHTGISQAKPVTQYLAMLWDGDTSPQAETLSMDKEVVVHRYDGILLSHKRE